MRKIMIVGLLAVSSVGLASCGKDNADNAVVTETEAAMDSTAGMADPSMAAEPMATEAAMGMPSGTGKGISTGMPSGVATSAAPTGAPTTMP